jgi:L-ascorbate metabolism protein UlaG (beta-lactamase superfamily)
LFKITWLGQAGILFENEHIKIMVDPYLSNSVEKIDPRNYRRVPVNEKYLGLSIDVIICTHDHMDHTDPETLKHYLDTEKSVNVLSPRTAWEKIRKFGRNHSYVQFNRHTEWTYQNVRFIAVKAEHSDIHAIGVIIVDDNKKYYITGDTLYNAEIFEDLPDDIDVLFLPVNGIGNNMNMQDAARFAEQVGAKKAVPVHWGMFDDINPNDFLIENKVIPAIYKELAL